MQQRRATSSVVAELLTGLAHEIADVLADRLKPVPVADLTAIVGRLEGLIRTGQRESASRPVELRGDSDRKWGYRFGVEGVINETEVRRLLGGVSDRTVDHRCSEGLIRRGKDGRRVVYCLRSVMDYLSGLEQ